MSESWSGEVAESMRFVRNSVHRGDGLLSKRVPFPAVRRESTPENPVLASPVILAGRRSQAAISGVVNWRAGHDE